MSTIRSPFKSAFPIFVAAATLAGAVRAADSDEPKTDAAAALVDGLESPVRALALEVLERNPEAARLAAAARAAEERAPQAASLPEPMASLTAFLLTPETRVGPQRASASLSQRFPWFGKLGLREREALERAAAAHAELAAKRLVLVTETRRLTYELAFLDAQERVIGEDRATLVHYEELARARYASGVGLEQAVVKLQAEISKDDNRLLELGHRRAALVAAFDALRDQPAGGTLPAFELAAAPPLPALDPTSLGELAQARRPELARARALVAAAGTASELAEKEFKPDVTLGLSYTAVGRRDDAPGRAMPPPGNGDDIVGVTLGVNLPLWRQRLIAGVAEAEARASAAADALRAETAAINQTLAELAARLPLTRDQIRLFDGLLVVQAEQALRSAEAAYSAGTVGALDLLDAERILLDVRIASARLRADYLISLARLEGALAAPLSAIANGAPR